VVVYDKKMGKLYSDRGNMLTSIPEYFYKYCKPNEDSKRAREFLEDMVFELDNAIMQIESTMNGEALLIYEKTGD